MYNNIKTDGKTCMNNLNFVSSGKKKHYIGNKMTRQVENRTLGGRNKLHALVIFMIHSPAFDATIFISLCAFHEIEPDLSVLQC